MTDERHPFRFGVLVHRAKDGREWRAKARRFEALGFSILLMGDHLWRQFAPISAVMAAAAATTRLRVGWLVLANDYRHPAIVAKEAATIDLLSDGRLEIGLGAGWMDDDYRQLGVEKDNARTRIDRLEESVELVRALFGGGPVDHGGRFYRSDKLCLFPLPVQQPGPPLHIGGGSPRVLKLAGRLADCVGITPSLRTGTLGSESRLDASAGATDDRVRWIEDSAARAGRDPERSMLVLAWIKDEDDRSSALAEVGLTDATSEGSPHIWHGPADAVTDQLLRHRERWGISYWVVQEAMAEAAAPVVALLAGT